MSIKALETIECTECGGSVTVAVGQRSACDECGSVWAIDVTGQSMLLSRPDDRDSRDLVLSAARDRLQEELSMLALGGHQNSVDLRTQTMIFIALQLDRLADGLEELVFGELSEDEEDEHGDE